MSIVEFILANLAHEAAVAQAVPSWRDPGPGSGAFLDHVRLHFPDRELRRCLAERLLVETASDDALLAMARVWSDAPDFDPEWA